MRKIRQFADRKEQQETTEPQASTLACCAHNCPLPGTISRSTSGGNWHCWAHDALEEPTQWPYLTQGINENRWLFRVADKIATMPWYDLQNKQREIENYLRGQNREDLCRMKNDGQFSERCDQEPVSSWIGRLRSAAYAAAFDYVQKHWTRAAA